MPRGRKPLPFEQTRRSEIFREIRNYAEKHNTLPVKFVIYRCLIKPKFKMSHETYSDHFDRLLAEGYLLMDYATGAISISKSKLYIYEN